MQCDVSASETIKNKGEPRGAFHVGGSAPLRQAAGAACRSYAPPPTWKAGIAGGLTAVLGWCGKESEQTNNNNIKADRVTPLLAQRFTLSGNSYFWRTAR